MDSKGAALGVSYPSIQVPTYLPIYTHTKYKKGSNVIGDEVCVYNIYFGFFSFFSLLSLSTLCYSMFTSLAFSEPIALLCWFCLPACDSLRHSFLSLLPVCYSSVLPPTPNPSNKDASIPNQKKKMENPGKKKSTASSQIRESTSHKPSSPYPRAPPSQPHTAPYDPDTRATRGSHASCDRPRDPRGGAASAIPCPSRESTQRRVS